MIVLENQNINLAKKDKAINLIPVEAIPVAEAILATPENLNTALENSAQPWGTPHISRNPCTSQDMLNICLVEF